MVSWREESVADEAAQRLLMEYFASRAEGFPAAQGRYRTTFPTAEDFLPPRGVFLIIQSDEGADVGCGGIRTIAASSTGATRYEVKHLWLQPASRGHGYGRALLSELESRARRLGAQELVLDTNASLTAAGGLYRSAGFESIEPYNDNPNATNWYRKVLGHTP